jgi:hypothetical protein
MESLVIAFSKIGGPFFTPKGIITHIKAPQSITKAILYWSSNAMEILWYPKTHLKMYKIHVQL